MQEEGVHFTCDRPKVDLLIPWPDVRDIRVEGETAQRVNVGAVALFGVLGLGAKKQRTVTRLTFVTSTAAHGFGLDMDPAIVESRLQPIISAAYVPDGGRATQKEVGFSLADELRKLAALRDEGILTPGEFEAQKARLLDG